MSDPPRRLVFGEVAELYDASRPSYPAVLVDDLVAWAGEGPAGAPGAGGPRALEIGAGTGKATRLLAARGVSVLAVEPSPEMAEIARRESTAGGYGERVTIALSDFETFDAAGRTFPLLYAAQAWHWVDQEVGYRHARSLLAPGGRLVALWNRPVWERTALRGALSEAYRSAAPELEPDGSMHPDGAPGEYDGAFWRERVLAADSGLRDPELRFYDWELDYTTAAFVDLLATMSAVRLMEPGRRDGLLAAVGAAIDAHGGAFSMAMTTRTAIARAA